MTIAFEQEISWRIVAPRPAVSFSQEFSWALGLQGMTLVLDDAPTGLAGTLTVSLTTDDGSATIYGPTTQAIEENPVGSGRYVATVPMPVVGDYFVVWTYGSVVIFEALEVFEDPEAPPVTHTITGSYWPDGTQVSVYLAAAWPDPSARPSGPVISTGVMNDDRVTFFDLQPKVNYVAYALGHGVRFQVRPFIAADITETTPGAEREEIIESKLTALGESVTTSVPTSPLISRVEALEAAITNLGVGGGQGHIVQDELGDDFAARPHLQFTGTGAAVTDDVDGGRTVVRVIDEAANPLDPRWAGGAFTDALTDSYAALNACLQASVAADRGRMFLPGYTFRTSQGLVTTPTTDTFVLEGVGGRESRIQLLSGVNADVLRVVGNGAGLSSKGRVVGVTFCSTAGSAPTNGKAGLALDAINKMHVQDCYVFGADIAFDMRNNSYGTRFIGASSDPVLCNVGLLLRGATPLHPFTAGSGSDITGVDCWLAGKKAAVWCELNAGGYHFMGGQFSGGGALSSETDAYGTLLLGLGYDQQATTTSDVVAGATSIPVSDGSTSAFFGSGHLLIGDNLVTYSARSGSSGGGSLTGVTGVAVDIPSGTPIYNRGRVANVELHGVSFEGSQKRHLVRAFDIVDGLALDDCSMSVSTCISVMKSSASGNSIVRMSKLAVRGSFTGTIPLDFAGLSGSWDIQEEQPNVVEAVTFNGVSMNFQTQPMIERSGLGTRSRAFFGDKIRFGGRTLRWNGSVLESHTDSSSGSGWAPAAAPTQGITLAGTTVIATTQTLTAPSSYAKAATADEVTGVVVATNGLIGVLYRATWQESVIGAALATIFLGANAVKISGRSAAAPLVAEAGLNAGAANTDKPLTTWAGGLIGAGTGSTAYTGDVATGQIFGQGQISTLDSLGGVCWIEVPAGTYTVSVQFKASSGNVTVKNRRLQVFTAA